MKKEVAEAIVKAAEENDIEGISLYEDYSGRGMYGKHTTAVTFSRDNKLMQAIAYAASVCEDVEEFAYELGRTSQDNMGRDYIVY